jgi:hypothetical protein
MLGMATLAELCGLWPLAGPVYPLKQFFMRTPHNVRSPLESRETSPTITPSK